MGRRKHYEEPEEEPEEELEVEKEVEEEEVTKSPEQVAHEEWCEEQWAKGKHPPAFHAKGSSVVCLDCEPRLVAFDLLNG